MKILVSAKASVEDQVPRLTWAGPEQPLEVETFHPASVGGTVTATTITTTTTVSVH